MSSAGGAPETENTSKDDTGNKVERQAVEDQPERPERGFSNPMFNETLPACIKSPPHPLQVVFQSLLAREAISARIIYQKIEIILQQYGTNTVFSNLIMPSETFLVKNRVLKFS
jgi:hypothetical protein